MATRIEAAFKLLDKYASSCDQRERTIPHRLNLIYGLMERIRNTHNYFDKINEHLTIDHFTVLELKFHDHSYITTPPDHGQRVMIRVVAARLQIGAGLHGRIFYRIIPFQIDGQARTQPVTGFLAEDYEWLDEDFIAIASEPIVKFIEIARTWYIDNNYIYDG